MIDLHCHVLPGIDDGPRTIEESLLLARAAAQNGTETVVATPHVSRRYQNEPRTIASLAAGLSLGLRERRLDLDIRTGAEIAAARTASIPAEDLCRLGLGGSQWLLIEPPFKTDVGGLEELVLNLLRDGHRVVLAHPERCPGLHREPAVLRRLVDHGVATSVTAGSLTGRFGGDVRRFALALAAEGLLHNVASDAHDHLHRPPSMTGEIEQAGLGPLTEWLTQEVPAAILAGRQSIPARPPIDIMAPRARWRRRGHSTSSP